MPLASIENSTSICGRPRGAGGMFSRLNWPSSLLSAAISRSPWNTRMVTDAESHAEDDRKQLEVVQARNALDTLVHSVRKSLTEYSDKVDADSYNFV